MCPFGIAYVIVLAAAIVLVALDLLLEPGRRRRVLWTLKRQKDWMFGLDVSRQARVFTVYVTLAALEDEGLVERQTIEPPEGRDRGFLPRSRYQLTEKGRVAADLFGRSPC